jgi:hypothetical protein
MVPSKVGIRHGYTRPSMVQAETSYTGMTGLLGSLVLHLSIVGIRNPGTTSYHGMNPEFCYDTPSWQKSRDSNMAFQHGRKQEH